MAKQNLNNKRKVPDKNKLKLFLKSKGHDIKRVDEEIDNQDALSALLVLHNINVNEYNIPKRKEN